LQQEFELVSSCKLAIDISQYIISPYVLVFIDGIFSVSLSHYPAQALAYNFTSALDKQEALLQQYMAQYAPTDLPGFTALNTALMQEGAGQ
jgi:SufBD protein N-terminal region